MWYKFVNFRVRYLLAQKRSGNPTHAELTSKLEGFRFRVEAVLGFGVEGFGGVLRFHELQFMVYDL